MITKCTCKSDSRGNTAGADYQDREYGKGNRIHTGSKESKKVFCTVCGKDKTAGGGDESKKAV